MHIIVNAVAYYSMLLSVSGLCLSFAQISTKYLDFSDYFWLFQCTSHLAYSAYSHLAYDKMVELGVKNPLQGFLHGTCP